MPQSLSGTTFVPPTASPYGLLGPCALVDVETSGLSPAEHRVLSVTVITVEESGVVSGEFHTLLDHGGDPGPVHVHGLTREKLSGAPPFEHVRPTLGDLLRDRIMVAHNASFDYGFLDHEFRRCGADFPVDRRLCTLALARRVDPPTPDRRLGSLAAHYGVVQRRAHDSLDDTRVLAGVLRGLLHDAARMGIEPPVLGCAPARGAATTSPGAFGRFAPSRIGPKPPCLYADPGKFRPGGPLVQGMLVAITGPTRLPRTELTARGDAAGLNMVGSVSRRTGLLVTDRPRSDSRKLRAAAEYGIPMISEQQFVELLTAVRPGTARSAPRSRPARAVVPRARTGPLAGQRILVLGGRHEEAAAARTRITELGGSAAVNLSAGVTAVLALGDAHADRRYPKVAELGLPVHGPELLSGHAEATPRSPASARADEPLPRQEEPLTLVRGQVIDLPADAGLEWTFHISWPQATTFEATTFEGTTFKGATFEVDVVAFVLDDSEQVTDDTDFVFYNQPGNDCVELGTDAPTEHIVTVRLDTVPGHARRILLAAAIDGTAHSAPGPSFADVGAVEVAAATGPQGSARIRATLDAATTERTLLLAEIYLREQTWRLRALGQGYETDLAALATRFGVRLSD